MAIPKVFSLFNTKEYSDLYPQIELLNSPFNIFLQCASYDIIIPVTAEEEHALNIFEETVLKLLDYKKSSVEEIAKMVCLEKDLVNYIIIRLTELNFIDRYRNPTLKGRAIINNTESKEEIGYIPGKIFVNKDTGEMLPYVHTGQIAFSEVEGYSDGNMKILCGTQGNNKTHEGRYITPTKDEAIKTPSQQNLRKIIRSHNKICSSNPYYDEIPLNFDYHIDITSSEDVFFHLQGVIQNGYVDKLIISDGFVKNSDELSTYITEFHPHISNELKRNSIVLHLNEYSDREEDTYTGYKEIYTSLKIRKLNNITEDEKSDYFENNKRTLKDCFSAFEWSLHYYLLLNPLKDYVRKTFEAQTTYENRRMCIEMLDNMNIKNGEKYGKLFSNIDGSKIRSYNRYKVPALYTLLPMCVAEAASNPESAFHLLWNKHPDFFSFIYRLNEKSQAIRHDVNAGNEAEDYDSVYKKTLQLIGILLPGFEKSEIVTERDNYNASRKRLNAEVSLSDELGSVFWENLDKSIQNELIKISPDKSEWELPSQYEYSLILSRVTESYLYETIKYLNLPGESTSENVISEIENEFQIILPDALRTVNSENFIKAKEKRKATLGAYILVFLRYADKELINQSTANDLIKAGNDLCTMRKHGNQVNLSVGIGVLNELRGQIFRLLKTIGGYYG